MHKNMELVWTRLESNETITSSCATGTHANVTEIRDDQIWSKMIKAHVICKSLISVQVFMQRPNKVSSIQSLQGIGRRISCFAQEPACRTRPSRCWRSSPSGDLFLRHHHRIFDRHHPGEKWWLFIVSACRYPKGGRHDPMSFSIQHQKISDMSQELILNISKSLSKNKRW